MDVQVISHVMLFILPKHLIQSRIWFWWSIWEADKYFFSKNITRTSSTTFWKNTVYLHWFQIFKYLKCHDTLLENVLIICFPVLVPVLYRINHCSFMKWFKTISAFFHLILNYSIEIWINVQCHNSTVQKHIKWKSIDWCIWRVLFICFPPIECFPMYILFYPKVILVHWCVLFLLAISWYIFPSFFLHTNAKEKLSLNHSFLNVKKLSSQCFRIWP